MVLKEKKEKAGKWGNMRNGKIVLNETIGKSWKNKGNFYEERENSFKGKIGISRKNLVTLRRGKIVLDGNIKKRQD